MWPEVAPELGHIGRCHRTDVVPQRVAQRGQVVAGHRNQHPMREGQRVGDERHQSIEVLACGAVENRRMHEADRPSISTRRHISEPPHESVNKYPLHRHRTHRAAIASAKDAPADVKCHRTTIGLACGHRVHAQMLFIRLGSPVAQRTYRLPLALRTPHECCTATSLRVGAGTAEQLFSPVGKGALVSNRVRPERRSAR